MDGRCKNCAHWVTHQAWMTVNPHPDWPSDQFLGFDHVLAQWKPEFRDNKGECKRASDDALMAAECLSEGISGELITKPDFGCIEHKPMPPGWDHYRLYRSKRIDGGTKHYLLPDDDMAHVERRAV